MLEEKVPEAAIVLSATDISRLRRVLYCNLLVSYSLIPSDWNEPIDDNQFHTARDAYNLLAWILVPYTPDSQGKADQIALKKTNLLNLLMTASQKKLLQELMTLYYSLAEYCDLKPHELIPPRLKMPNSLQSRITFFICQTLDKSNKNDNGLSSEAANMLNQYKQDDAYKQIVSNNQASWLEPDPLLLPIEPETNYYQAAYITKSWDQVAQVAVLCMHAYRTQASMEEKKAILLVLAELAYRDDIKKKLELAGASIDNLPATIKEPCREFMATFLKQGTQEESLEQSTDDDEDPDNAVAINDVCIEL